MAISQRLVTLIEKNADELTKNYISDVRKHPGTPTYHTFDEKKLYERAYLVYSQLGRWISRETTKEDIRKYYTALGAQRRREGFDFSEIVQALIILRRHVWLKVLSDGFLDSALDLQQALDLNNRVVLFFDRAIFFSAQGYESGE
jgi:hypothetical protein